MISLTTVVYPTCSWAYMDCHSPWDHPVQFHMYDKEVSILKIFYTPTLHLSLDLVGPDMKVRLQTEETYTPGCQTSTPSNLPIFITQAGGPFASSFMNQSITDVSCTYYFFSFIEVYLTLNKLHIFKVYYNFISFGLNIPLWNHHHKQENEHTHRPQNFLLYLHSLFLFPPHLVRRQPLICFLSLRLVSIF